MKIVLAGTFSGQGGIQTHFYWLAKALLYAGHEILIISFSSEFTPDDIRRADELGANKKLSIFCPRIAGDGTTRGACNTLLRTIQKLRDIVPDVYLACGTGYNLFVPAILSQSCGLKIFHEVMSGASSGIFDSRHLASFAFNQIATQANPVAENFRKNFGWQEDITVLPAFPEPLELTSSLPHLPEVSTHSSKIKAAFFGRMVPHKGAFWLASQWNELRKHLSSLNFHGTGPDQQKIEQLIHANGWEAEMKCLGAYPTGQAYTDLLTSYDVTLLPTTGSEGAPLVLLESMACGVPFVSYNAGGVIDYANPDCVIASLASPDSFIQGVQKICEGLREKKISPRRLQQFYMDHFSYTQLARKWCTYLSNENGTSGMAFVTSAAKLRTQRL
jgi:glycosyltransferase involved in cell wall biosynthesis